MLPSAEAQPPRPKRTRPPAWQALALLLVIFILGEAAYGTYLLLQNRFGCRNAPVQRILFIGNSYSFANDLPGMLSQLACAGGHNLETGLVAQGGWMLAQHATSTQTLEKLQQAEWDFVVLQEQSMVPASDLVRRAQMYPAARQLVGQIKATGGLPLFFMTWGHQGGWPEGGAPDYATMQANLATGYLRIADELDVPVAPVGIAWSATLARAPQVALWQADGSHPTEAGTYLAACVFYATLFRQSPVGLSYRAHLAPATAQSLQSAAADTVLTEPAQWSQP